MFKKNKKKDTPKVKKLVEVPKSVNYEIFILALSILSVVNIFLFHFIKSDTVSQVVFTIDYALSLVFFVDFFARLFSAKSKKKYFFNESGWLDLISSIPLPQFKIVRVVRIVRALITMRSYGGRAMLKAITKDSAGNAMYLVIFLVIMMMEFGSLTILAIEQNAPDANIVTASDALWWTIVTISTVGYGDRYPVTNDGRLVASFVIVLGVGLFGIVTGFLANRFLKDGSKDEENETKDAKTAPAPIQTTDIYALEKISKQLTEVKKQLSEIQKQMDSKKKS